MKKDSLRQLKKNHRGMTLVEVMVSVVILAIAALLLSTSFSGSFNLIQRGVDYTRAGDAAFAEAEDGLVGGTAGTLSFSAGVTPMSIKGKYGLFTEGEEPTEGGVPQVNFRVFEADES